MNTPTAIALAIVATIAAGLAYAAFKKTSIPTKQYPPSPLPDAEPPAPVSTKGKKPPVPPTAES